MKNTITLIAFVFAFLFASGSEIGQTTLKSTYANPFILKNVNNTVPDSIINVVNQATNYWSYLIKTSININVFVEWVSSSQLSIKATVLSSCTPGKVRMNFPKAPFKDVMYAISLAEKIAGEEINAPNEADIILKINKDIRWNIDSTTTGDIGDKVDLLTILIHEICHGLGYVGNFNVKNDTIAYVEGEYFTIFDRFVTDSANNFLYAETSSEKLYEQYTSDSLLFNGRFAISQNGSKKPRLFAPTKFDEGSTIYHLDENEYPKGDLNSLMTKSIERNEINRNIGPISLGIMSDIGWYDYFMSVDKIMDTENISDTVTVSSYINPTIDSSSIYLHCSFDGFVNEWTPIAMKRKNKGSNVFEADIPSFPFEHSVSYFITGKINNDTIGIPNTFDNDNFFSFHVGRDTTKPTLTHNIVSISVDTKPITFKAEAADNVGIDSVYVLYKRDLNTNTKPTKVLMSQLSGRNYSGDLILDDLVEGKHIYYRICSKDKAGNATFTNGIITGGFHDVVIGPISDPISYFDENFDNTNSEKKFKLDGFAISKPSGFDNNCLTTTTHPYTKSSIDGKYIQFIATINNPVKLRSKEAYLDFNEIVLLEPAEFGTVFGDHKFWDYCIIEGSKNKIDWYAFEPGYKTELHKEWQDIYDSKLDPSDKKSSLAAPTSSDYKNHKVNLLANKYLRIGDKVYIRFRMQSDYQVNAWGWAIDDIKIQTTPVAIDEHHNGVTIYPTVNSGSFAIHSEDQSIKNIVIYSPVGDIISSKNDIKGNDAQIRMSIPNGIYLCQIILDNDMVFTEKFIVE